MARALAAVFQVSPLDVVRELGMLNSCAIALGVRTPLATSARHLLAVRATCSHFSPLLLLAANQTTSRSSATTTPLRAYHCPALPECISIFALHSDGTCVRDYLHVLDLAKGHLLALDALAPESKVFDDCPTEARYKAYNLGKGKGMSVLQIVEAMRAETKFDFKYEIIGRR